MNILQNCVSESQKFDSFSSFKHFVNDSFKNRKEKGTASQIIKGGKETKQIPPHPCQLKENEILPLTNYTKDYYQIDPQLIA